MVSIKDKSAKMVALAQGELVRYCHAVEAGICGEDNEFHSRLKERKDSSKGNVSGRRINAPHRQKTIVISNSES